MSEEGGIGVGGSVGLLHGGDYLVVLLGGEDADEGHHALHEAGPVRAEAEVFGFGDETLHVHHGPFHVGVLGVVGDVVGVRRGLGGLLLHGAGAHVEGVEVALLELAHAGLAGGLLLHRAHHAGAEVGVGEGAGGGGFGAGGEAGGVGGLFGGLAGGGAFLPLAHVHAGHVVHPAGLAHGGHGSGHGSDLGGHLVHHVVGKVAVEHPVAGIVGDELDVAGLGDADEDGVAGPPGGFGDAAALGAGGVEGVAVDVHGVVVHAEVDEADADALALAHDERGGGGAGFAVEQEPVELHHHSVRGGLVGEDGVLLQVDDEVLVAVRAVGNAGVHDEGAEHAGELLHGHVGVVEEGAFLVDGEVVGERFAGLYGFLRDAGHAVVADVVFKAVPVDGGGFGELVSEDDADPVSLGDLDGGTGGGAVEAPDVDGFVGGDLAPHDVGGEAEDLGIAVELEGEVADVGGDDGGGGDGGGVSVEFGEGSGGDAEVSALRGDLLGWVGGGGSVGGLSGEDASGKGGSAPEEGSAGGHGSSERWV